MLPQQRSALLLKNAANDARDLLRWTVARGGPASMADLRNLAAPGASVALCLYDQSAAAQPLLVGVVPAGGTCGSRSCWKALGGSGGYVYRDDAGTLAGLDVLRLKVTGAGGLQLAADGKGVNLPLPEPGLALPVTMQLVVSDGTGATCWQARFGAAHKNDATTFRATSP